MLNLRLELKALFSFRGQMLALFPELRRRVALVSPKRLRECARLGIAYFSVDSGYCGIGLDEKLGFELDVLAVVSACRLHGS